GASIQSPKTRNQATREPLAALDFVIDQAEPALFLFKDLHPYLNRSHPAVVRRLKEIGLHLKNSFKTIFIVAPVLEMPIELEKETTVINFPLPNRRELGELLGTITNELKEHKNLTIEIGPESREQLVQAALGLTESEAENVFAKMLVKTGSLSGENISEIFLEKQQIVRKSGLLDYCEVTETISNVGGLGALKEWLGKRSRAFSEEARAFGLPAPKGILLLGVQGCGKSLSAKAVSSLWQMPLLRFDMGRMFGSLMGSSEENVRRAIQVAESVAPIVLWIDEIDKAFAGSGGSGNSDAGTSARVLGSLLTWLSEKTSPVFVVATANDISHLPPELLRKGRFDEIFFVDLPADEEREEIFRIHLERRRREVSQFDLPSLARQSEGYSGAEIEEAIITGLYDAFHENRELTTEDILHALQRTVPLSRTMDTQINALRAWAEGRARNASC
ncbi:MAG: AAA family ATPase, partial [Verrucomicrobiota bacterium]|nr:AAA family ATPase [Verrucomicrobiota bacterium]